jgi:7-cyano-7-deazaguanine synthase
MPRSAVVILSGGMDSTVLAQDLASQGYELTLVSFDYGQRHNRELESARACAKRLGATHRIGDLSWLGPMLPGSALTDRSVEVPDGSYAEDNLRVTEVPGRNADMLCLAFSIAAANDADLVAAAMHSGGHILYPDCTPRFVKRFQAMQDAGMEGRHIPRLHTPYIEWTKADICRRGAALGVPFQETWSCYKGGAVHCGRCATCVERVWAFEEAGIQDPTDYADRQYALDAVAAGVGVADVLARLVHEREEPADGM